jgi:hypothetical protein
LLDQTLHITRFMMCLPAHAFFLFIEWTYPKYDVNIPIARHLYLIYRVYSSKMLYALLANSFTEKAEPNTSIGENF